MFKYTKHQLKKIEGLLEEIGYTIRYEKGNFQSGINSLFDILSNIEIGETQLEEKSLEYYNLLTTKVISERNTSELENPA